jgi:hypothetical protein
LRLHVRKFSSFKSTLTSITSSLVNPFISSVFKAIRRNETLESRLAQFSKHYPDWEGPAAFIEGCGSALQALMELTNSRCRAALRPHPIGSAPSLTPFCAATPMPPAAV